MAVEDKVRKGTKLFSTSTPNMIVDLLAKGLPPKAYADHITHIGILSSFDVLG